MAVTQVIDSDGARLEVEYTPKYTCIVTITMSEDPYNRHTIELDQEDTKALASLVRECLKWMKNDAQ